ncbi:MAG: ATP-dependent DNA helicase [Acetobacteraceae bacterium]
MLVAGAGRAVLLDPEGVFHILSPRQAAEHLGQLPPLLVHAPATFRRLGLSGRPAYDLLELFAFVSPAIPVAPTVRGLALALGIPVPAGLEAAAAALPEFASKLLAQLAAERNLPINAAAGGLARLMGRVGWGWAPFVLGALDQESATPSQEGLKVWTRLPEWKEAPPLPKPSSHPVAPAEARARLSRLLGPAAEARPGQSDYAAAVSAAFAPREAEDAPRFVLAEAGTGIGKTLGYIAPASLWAERNQAPVWISTFTRHLQRQVEAELCRLYPEPTERRRRAVVRKGRENYLCLLNYEEAAVAAATRNTASVIPLGLIARWVEASADGDLHGGDLPGWISELFGPAILPELADRRGECIYAACAHWRRCFIEHNLRRARTADLVVANHALVMTHAAWGGFDEGGMPLRIVFDEGHRLLDAADAAFAVELSGTTMAELRRWLLGPEGGRAGERGRGRGLAARVGDLLGEAGELPAALGDALAAAQVLPAPGWRGRLSGVGTLPAMFAPAPAEALLAAIATAVTARTAGAGDSPETDLWPVSEELAEAGRVLSGELARIARPLASLARGFAKRLSTEADTLGEPLRLRLEAMSRVLTRRALAPLSAWREMLLLLARPAPEPGIRPQQICLLRLDRPGGAIRDAALLSHWLDPMVPFAATLVKPSHGLLVTSATLSDVGVADREQAWRAAEARTGAAHLAHPALRVSVQSPFDYQAQTRAFVVTDLEPGNMASLAAAYRVLFLAAGGGALGLFTAIRRLRAVYPLLAPALEAAGIPLYAQHVDPMDNATLVEIFRAEEESCLLGTDAMRDGVDVPGRALRLVVFEKVPWARPDILHRERRRHLAPDATDAYDERIARLNLRQAFGRLIRTASDHGCFVLLDRRTPSRLLSAFPEGVAVRRAGLAETTAEVRRFLRNRD